MVKNELPIKIRKIFFMGHNFSKRRSKDEIRKEDKSNQTEITIMEAKGKDLKRKPIKIGVTVKREKVIAAVRTKETNVKTAVKKTKA